MAHGTALYYLTALLVSAANSLGAILLVRRHRLGFLVPFRTFQIAFSVHGLLFFSGQIFVHETVTASSLDHRAAQAVISILSSPAFLVYSFATLAWCCDLMGRSLSRGLIIAFWVSQLLLEGVSTASFFNFVPGNVALDTRIVGYLLYGFHLPLVLSTGTLAATSFRQRDPLRRRLSGWLGGIYLAGFLFVFLGTNLLHVYPAGVTERMMAVGGSLFAFNLVGLGVLAVVLRGEPEQRRTAAADGGRSGPPRTDPKLTRRENEIVPLVARGLTNDEIAEELFISPKTVRNTLSSVYRKVGVRNRVELAGRHNRRAGE